MANRYANLVGSNKIKDEWQKINTGFDKVEQEMDGKPDHSIAQVNDIELDADDTLTVEGGTGITVTTVPSEKKVRVVATGEATPGPHAIEHITGGSDVIPNATTSSSGLMSAADKQMLNSHASRHASGGDDPLTPGDIGALPTSGGTMTGGITFQGSFSALNVNNGSNTAANLDFNLPDVGTAAGTVRIFRYTSSTNDNLALHVYDGDGTPSLKFSVYPKRNHIVLVGCMIAVGSGSPEGSVSAPVGSLYLRNDGGAGTTLYVKESGTGNTGWKAVQTA